MSAKEMFRKLKFKITIDMLGILRYSKYTKYADYHIRFHNDLKEWSGNKVVDNEILGIDINTKLNKAIQKQIEELSWEE